MYTVTLRDIELHELFMQSEHAAWLSVLTRNFPICLYSYMKSDTFMTSPPILLLNVIHIRLGSIFSTGEVARTVNEMSNFMYTGQIGILTCVVK